MKHNTVTNYGDKILSESVEAHHIRHGKNPIAE